MHAKGKPLRDWTDISIYYGIKTGYNPAFIIDKSTRDRLVAENPTSANILKPILRGRDIRRYRAKWAELWLISTLPSLNLDIDEFPAVKQHLLRYGKERLAQTGGRLPDGRRARKKTPHRWYELQDTCAYHGEFRHEKLFWIDLSDDGRFALANDEIYCVNSAYMLSGPSMKYLCAVLNSRLIEWYMRHTAQNSGMGTVRWIRSSVEKIPVPEDSGAGSQLLIRLIDEILRAKDNSLDADTAELEIQIDEQVCELYDLDPREIRAIAS